MREFTRLPSSALVAGVFCLQFLDLFLFTFRLAATIFFFVTGLEYTLIRRWQYPGLAVLLCGGHRDLPRYQATGCFCTPRPRGHRVGAPGPDFCSQLHKREARWIPLAAESEVFFQLLEISLSWRRIGVTANNRSAS